MSLLSRCVRCRPQGGSKSEFNGETRHSEEVPPVKRWIVLFLALCLLLPCAALGETAAEVPAAEEAEEAAPPTPYAVRYFFEHKLLPQLLYEEDPQQFLGYLNENGVFALWSSFTQTNGFDVIYTQEDFAQNLYMEEDGSWIMLVNLPKPEEAPLCSRVYLCWNPTTDRKGYYTVEYDNFMGEAWFLCGWNEDGTHRTYGGAAVVPDDPDDPAYSTLLQEEMAVVLELLNTDSQPESSVNPAADETNQ